MKILLATDGSAGARAATRFLAYLLPRPDISIQILTVQRIETGEETEGAEGILATAHKELERLSPEITVRAVETRSTTSGIVDRILVAAEALSADLVVTGSRGNSLITRFFLGSVALGVARHAPCSVLVGRARDAPLARIVVGIDETDDTLDVIRFLRRLPLPRTCTIHLVHVAIPTEAATHSGAMLPESLRQEIIATVHEGHVKGKERLAAAATALRDEGWTVRTEMRYGDPTTELLDSANGNTEKEEERADMLVVGARKQSTPEHYLIGSVSSRLIELASCSVLIVR